MSGNNRCFIIMMVSIFLIFLHIIDVFNDLASIIGGIGIIYCGKDWLK